MDSFVVCLAISGILIQIDCLEIAGQLFVDKLDYPGAFVLTDTVNGIFIFRYPLFFTLP